MMVSRGSNWATTQVELASALGVDRRTIQNWLHQEGNPGARSNGRYSVTEWKQWAKTHGKKIGTELSQSQLRARQIIDETLGALHLLADKTNQADKKAAMEGLTVDE